MKLYNWFLIFFEGIFDCARHNCQFILCWTSQCWIEHFAIGQRSPTTKTAHWSCGSERLWWAIWCCWIARWIAWCGCSWRFGFRITRTRLCTGLCIRLCRKLCRRLLGLEQLWTCRSDRSCWRIGIGRCNCSSTTRSFSRIRSSCTCFSLIDCFACSNRCVRTRRMDYFLAHFLHKSKIPPKF